MGQVIVTRAKAAARNWVLTEAARTPGLAGAFLHGSITWLTDAAVLDTASDVDVMLVRDDAEPPGKPGKLRHQGVMLDVSYLSAGELRSPEQVLGQYHLAGSFRVPGIIVDPSGHLSALQAAVGRDLAKRRWVTRRCEHARERILGNLHSIGASEAWPDQVTAWLFATGVTTHVLLVAGLRNPTVRRRYLTVRELLADYGRLEIYESLLELLGCARIGPARVEQHLDALTGAFDAAAAVSTTPFFFATDISQLARPIAIDGSRELIARGDHREAVFWLVATYSRCLKVLAADAPMAIRERFEPGYRELLNDLGIASLADLRRRGEQVEAFLPRLWTEAGAILAANPEIDD